MRWATGTAGMSSGECGQGAVVGVGWAGGSAGCGQGAALSVGKEQWRVWVEGSGALLEMHVERCLTIKPFYQKITAF